MLRKKGVSCSATNSARAATACLNAASSPYLAMANECVLIGFVGACAIHIPSARHRLGCTQVFIAPCFCCFQCSALAARTAVGEVATPEACDPAPGGGILDPDYALMACVGTNGDLMRYLMLGYPQKLTPRENHSHTPPVSKRFPSAGLLSGRAVRKSRAWVLAFGHKA